jgi:hypothetical protein
MKDRGGENQVLALPRTWADLRTLLEKIAINEHHAADGRCYGVCAACQAKREAHGLLLNGIYDPLRLACEDFLRVDRPSAAQTRRFRLDLAELLRG